MGKSPSPISGSIAMDADERRAVWAGAWWARATTLLNRLLGLPGQRSIRGLDRWSPVVRR